jgi:hypothetical protein
MVNIKEGCTGCKKLFYSFAIFSPVFIEEANISANVSDTMRCEQRRTRTANKQSVNYCVFECYLRSYTSIVETRFNKESHTQSSIPL